MILRKYQTGGTVTSAADPNTIVNSTMTGDVAGQRAREALMAGGTNAQAMNLSPDHIAGLIDGTIVPTSEAEKRLVIAYQGGAGSQSEFTDYAGQNEDPSASSRAIGGATVAGNPNYQYGGESLPLPPTALPAGGNDFGVNPQENLRYSYLDSINAGTNMARTRNEAFASARRAGKDIFEWEGSSYHTKTAEDLASERNARETERRSQTSAISAMSGNLPSISPTIISPTVTREGEDFEGILRGPQRRKANRQNRTKNKTARKETRKAEYESPAERKAAKKKTKSENKSRRQENRNR